PQAALDELFGERIVPQNFVGIRAEYRHEVTDFAKLLEQRHSAVDVAPAQFEDIDIGGGETKRCLKNGLWLLRDYRCPYVIVLSQHDDYGQRRFLNGEGAAPRGDFGAGLPSPVFDALQRPLPGVSRFPAPTLSFE